MKTSGWIGTAAVAAGVVTGYRLGFGSRSQLFGSFPYAGSTDEQAVALTFDDGPNEPWTSQILDTLADRGVPGTFFQVGRCAQRHPEVTRRVVDDGHVLGNHSMTHELSGYLRDVDQRAEVVLGRTVLAEIAGVAPRLYRPPWLCHWPWVLRGIAGTGSQVVSGTFVHPLRADPAVGGSTGRRRRPGRSTGRDDHRPRRSRVARRLPRPQRRGGRADHRPSCAGVAAPSPPSTSCSGSRRMPDLRLPDLRRTRPPC